MAELHSEGGFTLVELMVAVAGVIILAAVAIPQASGYLRQARLEAAKPYLAEIAARERAFMVETGRYCCTAGNLDENALAVGLGINLAGIGDFCFVVVCQSSLLCQAVSGPGFISTSSGPAPDFEVWGILQDGAGTANAGPGGTSCTPALNKVAPSGFVASATSNSATRGGRVVVLRYPPPSTGLGTTGAYHAVPLQWRDGITSSDAMLP